MITTYDLDNEWDLRADDEEQLDPDERWVLTPAGEAALDAAESQQPQSTKARHYDESIYEDTGCDLNPRCLTCPLPRCKYDEAPPTLRQQRNVSRDRTILEMRADGKPIPAIADCVGISARQVSRVIAKAA